MRFIADENVSHRVVDRLRADGFDVTIIGGAQSGASDVDVLKIAESAGRILITEDRDFGELVVRQRLGLRGVILLELDQLSNEAEAIRVAFVIAAHGDRLEGNLVVIEPGRVRVRPLSG